MSQADLDTRRKTRILTEDDLLAVQRLIGTILGNDGSGRPAVLLRDLTFTQAVGGIAAGTVFPIGTSHDDILARLAQAPIVPPTYTVPMLVLSVPMPTDPEIGSRLGQTFTPTWVPNDAGTLISYVLKKNDVNMYSGAVPAVYVEPEFTLTGTPVTYQAFVTHAAGPVKNDSDGAPFPIGRIESGTVPSNIVTIAGIRYGFYDADSKPTVPNTSSDVRDLFGRLPVIEHGTTFLIHVPVGARRITFWYPNTCRDVLSVTYLEQGGAEYRDLFLKTTANVEGANGFAAAPYKGFTWIPAVAPAAPMTLKVVI